jgi:hypothetical protein
MSDTEKDVDNLAIDPPDNQGGGNLAETSSTDAAAPIDPPDNQGGGSAG